MHAVSQPTLGPGVIELFTCSSTIITGKLACCLKLEDAHSVIQLIC